MHFIELDKVHRWLLAPQQLSSHDLELAIARGGTVNVPPGVYVVSERIRLSYSGTRIVGAGPGLTIFKAAESFRSGDMFLMDNVRNCAIAGVTIDGGDTVRTGGAHIRISGKNETSSPQQSMTGNYVRDVFLKNVYQGIAIDGEPHVIDVQDVGIHTIHQTGVGIFLHVTGLTGASQTFRHITINGGVAKGTASQPVAGIQIRGTGDARLHDINQYLCTVGLLIDPQLQPNSNPTVAALDVSGCLFDSNDSAGIRVKPGAGVEAAWLHFTNCWTAGNQRGVDLDGEAAGAIVQEVQVTGGGSRANSENGLYAHGAGVKHLTITGGQYMDNAADGAGIALNGCSDVAISGVRCGQAHYASGQKWGINVLAGTARVAITGCALTGNVTAAINDPGALASASNNV